MQEEADDGDDRDSMLDMSKGSVQVDFVENIRDDDDAVTRIREWSVESSVRMVWLMVEDLDNR